MISFPKPLRGKKVALDTMIFIYAFEEHSLYLPLVKSFFHTLPMPSNWPPLWYRTPTFS